MKKNMNKRMATAALAGAMVLSMNGMAFAAEEITEVKFSKEVATDGFTYAPNTTFEFEVTIPEEVKPVDGTVVYKGVDGGLTVGTIAFAPEEGHVMDGYTKMGTITVHKDVFKNPGVYHYQLKEKNTGYEGVVYDESVKDIYVTVLYDDVKGLYVDAVKVAGEKDESGKTAKLDTLKFTNIYGTSDPTKPEQDKLHDMIVKKEVTGNQGDRNKDFEFTITINPNAEGKMYHAVKTDKNNTTTNIVVKDATPDDGDKKATATFTLKHGETLHVYGLSESDEYNVLEADYKADGYTTTYTNNSAGKLAEDGVEVTITNDKHVGPATGVAMTFAPYVLLVAAAGGLGAVVLGKKKRDDEDDI